MAAAHINAVLPCQRMNRLVLGGPRAARAQLEQFLIALDQAPRQIQLRAVISKVERDEKGRELRTVLSQPSVILQDGKSALIMSEDGQETLELKITATVLEAEEQGGGGNARE